MNATEPIESITKYNEFSVGDSVKITDFYIYNYISGKDLKDKIATVVKVIPHKISLESIKNQNQEMYKMFTDKYGVMPIYNIFSLWIQYPDNKAKFLVSPFGFDKIK